MDTAEPDEFARLLSQLNGASTPEPTPTPAPGPAAAPAPVQPQAAAQPAASIAPAFGAAAPYPARVGLSQTEAAAATPPLVQPSIVFPTIASVPAEVAPPLLPPRAPELMGADELAAPPRQLPPLYDQAPQLVAPPVVDAPIQPVPVQPSPTPAQPSPAPSPAPTLTVAATATAAVQPGAAAQAMPATARPPLDFATLLTTPVGADDDARAAASAVKFASAPPDDDEFDLARSTAAEKVGLVLAFLVAPIGLIVGFVAAGRSAHRRGWVVGIVRASIAIAAVLTVALGIGGYFAYTQFKQQQQHDQTVAASAAFCAALKADPTMYQLPTFGWPAVASSIPDSLKAMQSYEDRWSKLAKVSPAGIKADVTKVATAAKAIIDSVTVARTIDDASNVAEMSEVGSSSGVPAWHSEYCG